LLLLLRLLMPYPALRVSSSTHPPITQTNSLVARFSLVCGEAWKVQLTNSLFFVGAFAGSGLFGLLCDRWVRKLPLFLATGFVTASMFGLLGATSYWAAAGLRVLCGVGAAGQSHCCFLLVTECVGPEVRWVQTATELATASLL
jgi:OCT family organic cation transporter-like MFS transporter 4/5